MAKAFFDVFPGLKLDGKLKSLFEQTQIERVTATKQKDFVRIYLSSERLIQKDDIFTVEGEIKKQLFAGCNITIKIHEKYRLSSQYNPEKLMEIYRDSILLELQEYSHLLYSMFKNAELSFPEEGRLNLRIEDTVLARTKSDELTRILEKVFFERCGLPVNVFVEYREARTGRFKEEDDIFIARRVAEITARYTGNKGYENGGEMPAPRQEMQAGQSGNAEGGTQKQAVDPAYEAYLAGAAKEAAKAESGQKPKDGGAPFEGGTVRPGAALEGKKFMGKKSGGFGRGKGKFKGDGDFFKSAKRSDNPDVIYGRDFEDEAMSIEDIVGEIGEVAIRGKILNLDKREIKNERTILIFDVTDFSDTMTIKMFAKNEQVEEICEGIKPGVFVKIKGITMIDKFDGELTIGSIVGVKKISDFTHGRMDHSVRKRVELHCHTKMSDMDGVSEAKDIVKRAYQWGHPAIAITDHGVVQSFPDANHLIDDLWKTEKGKRKDAGDPNPDKNDFFKVIYGVEAYLVDDLKEIVTYGKGQPLEGSYVVFDIETTGFSPIKNRIIEIGAVKVINGEITDRFSSFVNPQVPIPFEIEKLTRINDEMVMDAPVIEKVLPEFLSFCEGTVLVAHNASFDISFIRENAQRQQLPFDFTYVDTVGIARVLLPHQAKHTLDAVSKTLGISLENHHRAVDDAEATAQIFVKFTDMLLKDGKDTLEKVNALGDSNPDIVKRLPTYHAIILAKNNTGRVNLYKLISESHLTYYAKRPRIPKSLLLAHREGLILGSACEAGELYRALLDDRSDADIARIVNFYDYLEIQPTGNNKFMINEEKIRNINSIEDIQDVNKRIVALGEQYNKPVVATCDVHFLDPGDEVYRRIIMAGKGFKDSDEQAPLYLRTTEEMLEEFQYLGSDKAEEVVITNTNLIADQIETISPVRPDKCPPVIADSDKTLTEICYNKAHEMYGEKLPPIVEQRLEKELNSIIKNGFAVMYIIAQKLVWKSVEDGYLVGSRGSVGSSFVANMAGITEVNALSPHYYCMKCHYNDFDSPDVKAYTGKAGCDMPDKYCPVCGEPLKKDGFDIPFETFLGFKGDKEPDIDLNFSGEYQSKAHKYTEVIFGAGQTFRAGTIGTLADKTAFGYVKNYYEERGSKKRTCEINRIVAGCTGIRRSTGQHPGGIIVLPLGEEINSFTPVQHPANDMTTDTVTTHFDYHSIDHNLLKLDILGHDDPTMIRMLQDLTGIDPTKIPLDDPQVMSLFQNTNALGVTPEEIDGCPLGALGIPEFGTEFAMQMLLDTHPTSFSDLVRIAGLAHGTDVWLGNAQTLIKEGKATISTAICTRDDIMLYLIEMGVESSLAFTIMESVRKGKGLKPEMEEAMLAANVPDWYIWSCKKIKYMFPKAHAAAYVMMAWRIAYCKVNYPLAYYAAFFSIRASAFSYELMCQGQKHLESMMADYKRRADTLSKKEQDAARDMKVVQEMYARGFEFVPIDIFSAQSRSFQVVGDKIMPSLSSIDGLGEKAADAIVEAAKDGPFLSKDDFRQRTKVSKTVVDLMDTLNLLGNLPESNQISLFDFAI
ncbi:MULTISPECIES: PolC-type DNA polymerase III [Eisenbergiella]|uniref:DNA polymerase III PolC-type n=1 Tax=Eisenbergiella porci TaxID=2652274 RepID=A0A6N7WLJ3_9FIRM|nr:MULTISPECIES: PolC-type DNA polymerase III [Eisenbergiella]MDY2654622.1 PolC-type DNA polymerase III [Eisenbergiella porci]MSS90288.1 PolC-type DNA polymerase III [Eisenbergiella porci]